MILGISYKNTFTLLYEMHNRITNQRMKLYQIIESEKYVKNLLTFANGGAILWMQTKEVGRVRSAEQSESFDKI